MLIVCLLAANPQSPAPSPTPHVLKSFGDWTLSTTPSQKKVGDFFFTNKNEGTSILHKYSRANGKELLKSRLTDFAAAPESKDIVKTTWKKDGWTMHLVVRSVEKQVVGTFCSESKSEVWLGTTNYPIPFNKASTDAIQDFYHSY